MQHNTCTVIWDNANRCMDRSHRCYWLQNDNWCLLFWWLALLWLHLKRIFKIGIECSQKNCVLVRPAHLLTNTINLFKLINPHLAGLVFTSYAPGPGVDGLGFLNLSSLEHSKLSFPLFPICSEDAYSPGPDMKMPKYWGLDFHVHAFQNCTVLYLGWACQVAPLEHHEEEQYALWMIKRHPSLLLFAHQLFLIWQVCVFVEVYMYNNCVYYFMYMYVCICACVLVCIHCRFPILIAAIPTLRLFKSILYFIRTRWGDVL